MKGINSLATEIIILLVISAIPCSSVWATGELTSVDARSFALGNLHALSGESINPAGLSFQTRPQLSVAVLNRFEMKELNTVCLRGKYPNSYLDAGLSFSSYGYEDYRITQTSIGLAKKILPELAIGLNFIYFRESSFLEETLKNRLSSDVGIYYQPGKSFTFAFLADNVLHTFPDKIRNFYGGMSYAALENCFLLLEAAYGENRCFNLSLGIEYELVEQLKVRTGFQTDIRTPSFGAAFQWKQWAIDAGFSLHPTLGVSSIIGFNYHF